jgi:hypothetical protein
LGRRMSPRYFVSVASKGLSPAVSLLFATLARRFISVAAKGLIGGGGWRESNGMGCEDSGGLRRTTWRAGMAGKGGKESCRPNETIIAYWYRLSMITLSGLFAIGL